MPTETTEQIVERFKSERRNEFTMSKHDLFSEAMEDQYDSEGFDLEHFDWAAFYKYIEEEGLTKEEADLWWDAQQKHADMLADLGAKYLDQNYAGWRDDVNPDRLDMSNGYQCVLGQMFGDYGDGIRRIYNEQADADDAPYSGDPSGEWPKERGFLSNGACYQALDLAWNRVLNGG